MVCSCFIVLSVTICTIGYVCLFCGDQIFVYFVGIKFSCILWGSNFRVFCGDQIFVYFVSFLSMMIYEVLYTWCLRRHNICST